MNDDTIVAQAAQELPVPQDAQITQDTGAQTSDTPSHEDNDASTQDHDNAPPKDLQRRINKLVWEREEEKRRADQALALAERLLKNQQPAQQPAPQRNPLTPPNPADYAGTFDPAYIEALTDYKVAVSLDRQAQQQAAQAAQAEMARHQQTLAAQEEAFRAQHGDYNQAREFVLATPAIAQHPGISQAVLAAEQPAELIYWLGTHPEDALRIASMDPLAAAMQIGRISASLGGQPAAPTATRQLTKAPAPINPIGGAGASTPNTDPARAANMAEYERLRAAQRNKR